MTQFFFSVTHGVVWFYIPIYNRLQLIGYILLSINN